MPQIEQEIGKLVRYYRKVRGLTQGQLAEAMGITAQQVHKYETGANRLSVSNALLIAGHLDVPVTALMPCKGADAPAIDGSAHRVMRAWSAGDRNMKAALLAVAALANYQPTERKNDD